MPVDEARVINLRVYKQMAMCKAYPALEISIRAKLLANPALSPIAFLQKSIYAFKAFIILRTMRSRATSR